MPTQPAAVAAASVGDAEPPAPNADPAYKKALAELRLYSVFICCDESAGDAFWIEPHLEQR